MAAPDLTSISPNARTTGGIAFTLTCNGANYTASSVVRVDGADRVTTFVGATLVTAAILASDIAAQGTKSITVYDPGGGSSGAQTLTINTPTVQYARRWRALHGVRTASVTQVMGGDVALAGQLFPTGHN